MPTGYAVDVTQGASQSLVSSFGPAAVFVPPLNSPGRNLATAPEVWGWRRDLWTVQSGAVIAGNTVFPLNGSPALHFVFDGAAFEMVMAGPDAQFVLIADGQFVSPRWITTRVSGGVAGLPLTSPNALVRVDFGLARSRRLSLYARSAQGLCGLVMPAGATMQAWNRSGEAAFAGMSDSYGQQVATLWGTGGPFFDAAARLGLPHLALSAIGGTGYALNNATADTRDPTRAFEARLPSITLAQPDLVLTAGGINDNNWLAAPPLFASVTEARASFEAAVPAYYRALRAALPQALLVALGPWTPPRDPSPPEVVQQKLETIRAGLTAAGGPWVMLDNISGQWVASSGAMSMAAGQRWQTGRGWQGNPIADGGNSNAFISDGTHPNEEGNAYLAGLIAAALRAAIVTF